MDHGKRLLNHAQAGEISEVTNLLALNATIAKDFIGRTALHLAAENNHHSSCLAILQAGFPKDAITKTGKTPLHLAVYNGHEDIVKLLLNYKCNVNARDMFKYTPLHWAVEKDEPKLVKLLLEFGADPYAEAKNEKKTPLQLAQELQFKDMVDLMVQHKRESNISMEEQKEATDCLMQEMVKEDSIDHNANAVGMSQDSASRKFCHSPPVLIKTYGKGQAIQTVRCADSLLHNRMRLPTLRPIHQNERGDYFLASLKNNKLAHPDSFAGQPAMDTAPNVPQKNERTGQETIQIPVDNYIKMVKQLEEQNERLMKLETFFTGTGGSN